MSHDEGSRLIERAKATDCQGLAARLLESARATDKFACPVCPSSDALHVYEDGARCYSGAHPGNPQMDAIDIVQAALGLEFKEAVEHLTGRTLDDARSPAPSRARRRKRRHRADQTPKAKSKSDDESGSGPTTVLLERLVEVLDLDERGADYLASRGIPEGLAREAGVVSCTHGQWGAWCGKAGDDGILYASGLVAKADTDDPSLHPFYSHFLVFPYWSDGGLETVRFRATESGVHPKMLSVCGTGPTTSAEPYLSGSVGWARSGGLPLFVVEGELDALSVVACGYPAVATYSASVWPQRWCAGWDELTCVVCVAEGDPAGDAFVDRVVDASEQEVGRRWTAPNVHKVKIQRGKDCNDLLMERGLKSQLDSVVHQLM